MDSDKPTDDASPLASGPYGLDLPPREHWAVEALRRAKDELRNGGYGARVYNAIAIIEDALAEHEGE